MAFFYFYCVFSFGLNLLSTARSLSLSMHGAVKCWRKLGSIVALPAVLALEVTAFYPGFVGVGVFLCANTYRYQHINSSVLL